MDIKKFFTTVFMLSILFLLPTRVFAFSGSGTGVGWDPYVITTPAQLKEMNNDLSADYELGNDIEMKGVYFTGIGSRSRPFTGTLDGKGYSIKNMKISEHNATGVGFINYMSRGGLANINMVDAEVVGYNDVGILIGNGSNGTQVHYCTTSGSVYGEDATGGIVGRVEDRFDIDYSGSTAVVMSVGSDTARIGGIVGHVRGALHVDECYFAGEIQASMTRRAGGIAGAVNGDVVYITNCYVNTTYFSTNTYTGGIIGYTPRNMYAFRVASCYFTGHFTPGEDSYPIASSEAEIVNCYFNSTTTKITYPSSQARTDSQMKSQSTYSGFDFSKVWEIGSNTYPTLRNAPVITLAAPANLRGTAAANSVTLNWNAVSGAKGYEISYYTSGSNLRTVTSTTNSTTITGLSVNTNYNFKVRVRNTGEAGKWSSPVSIKTLSVLTVPTNLKAEALTPTSVKLTWTAVSTATSYKINDGTKDITVSGGATNSYTVTGLQPSTQYSFKIMAVRNSESTAYSSIVNVTTPDEGNISGLNYTIEDDNALITWNTNANAQHYIVSVNDVTNTVNTNQYTLTDLAYDTDYKVKVQAKFSGYDGPWSSEITINRGPEPFIPPTAIELSSSQIVLTEGESAVLSAIVLPADADDKELEFNIVFNPNTSIELELIDDSSSRINGLNAGMAEIEVKSANFDISETCIVIIEKRRIPVTDIVIYFDETTELTAGEEYPFVCELLPLNATDRDPNIISKHPEIIEISPQGTLLAKSPGTATIRVESNAFDGIFKEIDLVVIEEQTVPEPERIVFNMPDKIALGTTMEIDFTVEPIGALYEVTTMRSTGPAFFEVIDGVVHPYAEGTAGILVILDNGVREVHQLEVVAPIVPEKIVSQMEKTTFVLGEEFEILYEVQPEEAVNKEVTLLVTTRNVLEKIDDKTVRAIGEGEGYILLTSTANPGARTTIKVDIVSEKIPVEDIRVSDEHHVMTMQTGETVKLKVDFTPEDATNQNLIFDDLLLGCVDITADGTITAISPGFTIIMIISEENPSAVDFSNITVVGASRTAVYGEREIADYVLNIGEREEIELYGEYDFYSSDKDVIQIQNGMINAVGEGYAGIIAMDEGRVVSVCIVYVK